jgi:hypothetical protein
MELAQFKFRGEHAGAGEQHATGGHQPVGKPSSRDFIVNHEFLLGQLANRV